VVLAMARLYGGLAVQARARADRSAHQRARRTRRR
jgi:hypothetical protein